MPVPIFKINVDDTAFKNFLKTFNKYQESLNEQPENWKGINDEIATSVTIAASLSAEIAHQFELTRELMKLERDHDKQQEKIVSKRRKEMKSLLEDAKSFGSAAMGYGGTAIKYAAGAITGGALGGYWGMDKLGGWAGDQRRAAMGLGISVGSQQRANVALNRYFNVNSALENIANLKASPEGQIPFGVMGIRNVAGKDPSQLLYDVAQAAGRMFGAHKGPGQMAFAQAAHLTDIFSPDELRVLSQVTKKDEFGQTMRRDQELRNRLGIADQTGRKWQDFSSTLDAVEYKLKDVFADKMSVLSGPLAKVTKGFETLIEKVINETNLNAMARGINAFADTINSGEFQKGFSHFIEEIGKVGKIVDWIFDHIPGLHKDDPAGGAKEDALKAADQGWFTTHRGAQYSEAYKDIAGNYLLSTGNWNPAQVRGILANFQAESHFNPLAQGDFDKRTGKYTAYGIGQWHKDRQDIYAALLGHTMQSVTDPAKALGEQLWFANWELTSRDKRNKYRQAGDHLKREQSAFFAAGVVSSEYEKPKNKILERLNRGAMANSMTIKILPPAGTSVATTTNSAAGG